jgi:hypothetical protein
MEDRSGFCAGCSDGRVVWAVERVGEFDMMLLAAEISSGERWGAGLVATR